MSSFKQVIIVRNDLRLPKGKACSQVAHASVDCVLRADRKTVLEWRAQGMPKVITKVDNLAELRSYEEMARKEGIVHSLITDAGKTTVEPGTVTCLGVGPDKEKKIDKLTKRLKLL